MAERDAQIAELIRTVEDRNQRITAILSSTCWRLTAPVRMLKAVLRPVAHAPVALRQTVGRHAHRAYLALPLPAATRLRIKDFVFMWLGWLMSGTATYQAWDAARGVASNETQAASRTARDASQVVASLPQDSNKENQQVAPHDSENDEEVYVVLSSQLEAQRRMSIERHRPPCPELISFEGKDLGREADRIVLATSSPPSVSIIVPVYNQARSPSNVSVRSPRTHRDHVRSDRG